MTDTAEPTDAARPPRRIGDLIAEWVESLDSESRGALERAQNVASAP